ncbi:unnamed protein product [Durusdinium trenchii]|uniref:Ion transport domain-containing protein n=1 Tax=Durusdinium trenchii TaxID=1381693 RepID=A0ABP0HQV9_9DINO
MEWTTRLFWTLDIFFSCFTGVVMADGSVEYNIKTILKRYAKTWLTMDLVIVLSDWSEVVFSSGGVAMLSFARTTRIIRIVRLLRLVRMQEIMANVTERIQSETLGPLVQVSNVSHFTGCLWFAIGNRTTSEKTWVAEGGWLPRHLKWRMISAQSDDVNNLHHPFSGGMDEISPASPLERLFAVAVGGLIFVIALVMMGVFTSGLTQQYIIGGSGARQLATLKRYLKQNNVSKESVELLHVISEPLKIELAFDMYSQVLMCHPFFLELLQESSPMLRPICHRAMSMLLLSGTDVIFNLGEEPQEPKMYIVINGTLEYTDAYGEITVVGERKIIAEVQVCWTARRGNRQIWRTPNYQPKEETCLDRIPSSNIQVCLSDAKLAMLDGQGFIDICQRFLRRSEAAVRVVDYAAQFVEELNKSASRRVHPIGSDLRVCGWCGFGVQSKFSVMFGGVTTYP